MLKIKENNLHFKHIIFIICLLFQVYFLSAYSEKKTYFKGLDYELDVYFINGAQEGPTLMIIGGIQGDETAAFLAADYFIDIALKKGNLILIPRANLPSIFVSQRVVNADMNRRFAQVTPQVFEDEVVQILKKYMHKSDLMLNLHEGSGFYRHEYIGPMHNPMRYGQCLIADTDIYRVDDKVINLKEIAENVIKEINKQIDIEEYLYRFNNHNTINPDTRHPEQRGSASYYGLTQAQIPSFGVEVSKSLPTETLKKEYIKLIINEFMNYMGIEKDCPPLFDEEPIFEYIRCLVDNQKKYYEKDDIILIPKNSFLEITGIKTNYLRGNYAYIKGSNTLNGLNKRFQITQNTEIIVYKDNNLIAKIPVRIIDETILPYAGLRLKILDDNSIHTIAINDTLKIVEGVDFEITGTVNNNNNITINLIGYNNKVRLADDSNFIINTHSSLDNKLAINQEKDTYKIMIKQDNEVIGYSYLKVLPIEAYDLKVYLNNKEYILSPGDTLYTKYNDVLFIDDVNLKQISSDKVKVNFAGYILDPRKDAEDRGGNIFLNSKGLIPRFAVNKDKNHYEIHVLFNRQRYATYTIVVDK